MSRLLGRLAGALLLTFAFAVGGMSDPTPAYACSCVSSSGDVAYADRADAVFVGRLVATQQPTPNTSSLDPKILTFAVSAVYKGEVGEKQDIVTAVESASCGLELSGPGPHLIFARALPWQQEPAPAEDQLIADLCGGSRSVTVAAPDPALGAPATTYPAPPAPAPTQSTVPPPTAVAAPATVVDLAGSPVWSVVGAVATVGLAAGLLGWLRRTSSSRR